MPPQRECLLSRFGPKTDIDHYGLESGMDFKGTTRACKRMENGMFWSEIGSGFKEPGGTKPPRIPRSTPSTLRTELPLYNISFDAHALVNEIKIKVRVAYLSNQSNLKIYIKDVYRQFRILGYPAHRATQS